MPAPVTGEWRKRHNAFENAQEFEQLYNQRNTVGVMKSKKLEWTDRVVKTKKKRWPRMLAEMFPWGQETGGQTHEKMDELKEDMTRLDAWRESAQRTGGKEYP